MLFRSRWSGRTSASAPFTLPMGVRQASTTNTELTLSYLSTFGAVHPTIRHERAAPDSPGPPAARVVIVLLTRAFRQVPGGSVANELAAATVTPALALVLGIADELAVELAVADPVAVGVAVGLPPFW